MGFNRYVEVGRVVLINHGPDAGKLATVIDIVDQNKCLVEGPEEITGVSRQVLPYSRIALTDLTVKIQRNARSKTLKAAWKEGETLSKWEGSAWAKKLDSKKKRANLSGDKASSKALPRLDGGRGTRQSTSSHQHQQHQSSGSNMAVADTTGPTDTRPTIVAPPSVTSSSRGGESSPSSTSLESMTLSELLAEKRSLKNRLKQFDMEFHRKNKRMPVKSEKEPIRYLYEKYNNLKSRIQTLSSSDNNSASSTITPQMHPAQKDHAGGRYSRTSLSSYSVNTESSGEDSIPETLSAGSSRHHSNRRSSNSSSGSLSSGTPTGSTSSDLEALRLEKTQLHQLLRSFERDFYKENQRQVSSFADIRPVASQYRRYKEIKRSIAALQEGTTSGSGSGR